MAILVGDFSGRLDESPYDSLLCQDAVMPKPFPVASDTELQNLIDKRLDGDPGAHDALLNHACDRLLKLTRKMFHTYPQLRRWEQTDDVFQI